MKKFLLDVDPLAGVRQYFAVDSDGQEYLIDEVDDTDTLTVLDRNRQMEGAGMGKDMRLAASVPIAVQYEWLDKFGVNMWDPNHKQAVAKLLNSNEYRFLRINHFML